MFETAIIGAYVAGAIPFGGALVLLSRVTGTSILRKIGLAVMALGLTGVTVALLVGSAAIAQGFQEVADQFGNTSQYLEPTPVSPEAPMASDQPAPENLGDTECAMPEENMDMATWTYCNQ